MTRQLWPDSRLIAARAGRSAGYVVIPSAARPKLIVPRRPLSVAAAAVRHYNTGASGRERLTILGLAAAVRAGLAEVLPSRLDEGIAATGIRAYLREVLGQDLDVSLYIGPARAVRKPVVQILNGAGRTIAFAKLGVDEFTGALVRSEAAALRTLAGAPLRALAVPELMHHGRWNSYEVLVLRAMLRGDSAAPGDALLGAAMDEVARVHGVERVTLGGSTYRTGLDQRIEAQPDGPLTALLARSANALGTRHADAIVEIGAWHGDWTPWNMTVGGDRVRVWDWEKFEVGKPIGFDAVHYAVHWTMATSGSTAREAFETTLRRAPDLLAPHRIDDDGAVLTVWLYVLELAVRYLEDDEMNAGSTALSRLSEWLEPVLAGVERRAASGPEETR